MSTVAHFSRCFFLNIGNVSRPQHNIFQLVAQLLSYVSVQTSQTTAKGFALKVLQFFYLKTIRQEWHVQVAYLFNHTLHHLLKTFHLFVLLPAQSIDTVIWMEMSYSHTFVLSHVFQSVFGVMFSSFVISVHHPKFANGWHGVLRLNDICNSL